jgi:hypothetical protein
VRLHVVNRNVFQRQPRHSPVACFFSLPMAFFIYQSSFRAQPKSNDKGETMFEHGAQLFDGHIRFGPLMIKTGQIQMDAREFMRM